MTGQMGGQGGAAGVIRAASVTEDPSQRRANASPDNTQTMSLYVIPMMPPQIIEIFAVHKNDLPKRVTQANPAKSGDTLILYATGLGPVRDQGGNDVPIGQPIPANTTVISPVTVTIGLTTVQYVPQSAQGCQGFSNGYLVELILPNFAGAVLPDTTSIQINSAWIQSAAATLYLA